MAKRKKSMDFTEEILKIYLKSVYFRIFFMKHLLILRIKCKNSCKK